MVNLANPMRPRTKEEVLAMRQQERRLAERSISLSDYKLFDENKRREIIVEYVKFITNMGFKPIKVFGAPDPEKAFSFRAMFEFIKPNMVNISRKHTAFFESRNWSQFSLRAFNNDVLETTNRKTLDDFTRALRIRIWNIGFTDEEILCAILGKYQKLVISDVVSPEGQLVIPPSTIDGLFFDLNITGGNQNSARIIKRARPQQQSQPRR